MKLGEVLAAQPPWLRRANEKFFGTDASYSLGEGRSGQWYLVIFIPVWNDRLYGNLDPHYRLEPINQETYELGLILDEIFATKAEVDEWLKGRG